MAQINNEEKTTQYYDRLGDRWFPSFAKPGVDSFWADDIKQFHKLLPSGSVIEIGCGRGDEARLLIELGYDYVGLDISIELVKVARAKNQKATLLHETVYNLESLHRKFNGFWAAAMLLHIPKVRVYEVLESIKKVLVPGAVGFISLKEGVGESEDQKTGRWFSYYSEEEFTAILKNAGFVLKKFDQCYAADVTWLNFFVKMI